LDLKKDKLIAREKISGPKVKNSLQGGKTIKRTILEKGAILHPTGKTIQVPDPKKKKTEEKESLKARGKTKSLYKESLSLIG